MGRLNQRLKDKGPEAAARELEKCLRAVIPPQQNCDAQVARVLLALSEYLAQEEPNIN